MLHFGNNDIFFISILMCIATNCNHYYIVGENIMYTIFIKMFMIYLYNFKN